jgi:hypothetical protein
MDIPAEKHFKINYKNFNPEQLEWLLEPVMMLGPLMFWMHALGWQTL